MAVATRERPGVLIASAKTQDKAKQVGTELLEPKRIGVVTLGTTSDEMFDCQLSRPDTPIRRPIKDKEHR